MGLAETAAGSTDARGGACATALRELQEPPDQQTSAPATAGTLLARRVLGRRATRTRPISKRVFLLQQRRFWLGGFLGATTLRELHGPLDPQTSAPAAAGALLARRILGRRATRTRPISKRVLLLQQGRFWPGGFLGSCEAFKRLFDFFKF